MSKATEAAKELSELYKSPADIEELQQEIKSLTIELEEEKKKVDVCTRVFEMLTASKVLRKDFLSQLVGFCRKG